MSWILNYQVKITNNILKLIILIFYIYYHKYAD